MNERMITFPVDGTAALRVSETSRNGHTATIIEFPVRAHEVSAEQAERTRSNAFRGPLARLKDVIQASEMYCSLVSEDARGVVYNLFGSTSIATLAVAGFVVGALSIAFGA